MSAAASFARSLSSAHADVITVRAKSTDNYMYIVADKTTKEAAVVDPIEPDYILERATAAGYKVTSILTTHSHWDHSGGNTKLAGMVALKEVYGGKGDNIPGATTEVWEGDTFKIGSLPVSVMATPCHTPGHVCYVAEPKDAPKCVFTGDTLFVCGCGNFNSGTPAQMHSAFVRLGKMPDDTLLYVGHEYTKGNLAYAIYVEPKNDRICRKVGWAAEEVARGRATVPTTVGEEKLMNPFMRAAIGEAAVLEHAKLKPGQEVAAVAFVRKEKSGGAWKKAAM